MPNIRRMIFGFLCSLLLCSTALAQTSEPDSQPSTPPQSNPIVTATAGNQHVRYVAMGEVHQTRLQVFSVDGAEVFDSTFRLGNLIDWQLQDQQGQHLADGSYLFLVTVRDFSDRLTQKYGIALLEQEDISLSQSTEAELSRAQATTLESNKQAETLSVIDRVGAAGANRPTTATDGGTVIDAAPSGKNASTSKPNAGGENIAGTGTQNAVAKWIDNSGTLGDSIITEVNGQVGIGTTNPQGQLHIFGKAGQDVFAGMGPDLINGPALNFGYAGSSFGRGAGFFNVRPDASATAPNPSLRFATVNVQRMIITNTGKIGIGTLDPQSQLDVAGDINTSMQYNIAGTRILSNPGSGNLFAGESAGNANSPGFNNSFFGQLAGTSTTTNYNAFFGRQAGFANTSGQSNSFFGALTGSSNTTGSYNSFVGYLAGGEGFITGSYNSFFGTGAGPNSGVLTGMENSFFGTNAGSTAGGAGSGNSFFGTLAGAFGSAYIPGSNNTMIGTRTSFGAANLNYATAIGAEATVSANNTIALGRSNGSDTVQIPGVLNVIGQFTFNGNRILSTPGSENLFTGIFAGGSNTSGSENSFFGYNAGASNTSGSNNTIIGSNADVGANNLTNATAIGSNAHVSQNDSLVLGNGVNVGIGTTAPVNILHLNGNHNDFALTFTNQSNTAGRRGYRIAFDSDRLTFQSASDSGAFAANQMAIDPATGNVGVGTASPLQRLHVAGGNLYVANPNGVIITSPNGACWLITVSNAGALSAIPITCP